MSPVSQSRSTSVIRINDDSADNDFRIESDGNGNMLFVDGGNDVVNVGGATAETGDTFSIHSNGNYTTQRIYNTGGGSDGPLLIFQKDSPSPADDDALGDIRFHGDDDGGTMTQFARIKALSKDVTNGTEDGQMLHYVIHNGSTREVMRLGADTIFNQDGQDIDFRIESNGNANMLLVDAGNDFVGIGSSTQWGGVLNVTSSDNGNTLVLACTDTDANAGPLLSLYRSSSSSAADGDVLGTINFQGLNDANQAVTYALIENRIVDASDGTEDGRIEIATILAGTAGVSRLLMDATETVFNDNSKDLDFRIESDDDANMFFVEASTNRIGIRTNAPEVDYPMTITGVGAKQLLLRSTGDTGYAQGAMVIASGTTNTPESRGQGVYYFNEGQDRTFYAGTLYQSADHFGIGTSSGTTLQNDAADTANALIHINGSEITLNENSNNQDFRVESDSNNSMLFVDAGNNSVNIGSSDGA